MQSFDRLNHSSLVLEWKRLKLLVSVLSGRIFGLQTLTLSEVEANLELYLTFRQRRRES